METDIIRLFLAATTCISGLILLYFAITHLRYLKDSANKMIEHIKKLIVAKEKEENVRVETHQALKKIDDKVKETIREIDDSFDSRYKKFSDQIDNFQYKLPQEQAPQQPIPAPQPVELRLEEPVTPEPPQPVILVEGEPKYLIYIGPIAIGLGFLYYFLSKGRKK